MIEILIAVAILALFMILREHSKGMSYMNMKINKLQAKLEKDSLKERIKRFKKKVVS